MCIYTYIYIHSVPHSARGSVTALISARSFAAREASRTMSTANMINQTQVTLNNTIMVHCETKDFEILPEINEDTTAGRAAATTSSVPAVIYDKNGRSHFIADNNDTLKRTNNKNSKEIIGGFSTTFEEACL
jgi:ATP/ADP translocase